MTLENLTEKIETGLPESADLFLADPEVELEALVEVLGGKPQPQVTSLRFGKADFSPLRDEFPEEPCVYAEEAETFFAAFPNLEHLEIHGWALFNTFSHPKIKTMKIHGCPSYELAEGMIFPQLETLVWQDAEDSHGLSCFEYSGGLEWALDANRTPKLFDIVANDATSNQLCDESLSSIGQKTIERIRLRDMYWEQDFKVKMKTLEILDADLKEFELAKIDLAALAEQHGLKIVSIESDGSQSVLAG